MITLRSIIDAYADAYGEALEIGYEQGDSTWTAPPTFEGRDVTW
ncbi:MAG TPA: hypothetical protein VJ914_04510 [Pseudonocardiaceae bacterium]|nr:hypothetical protein [Pseudonocardiaceae bacterium]